VGGVSIVHESTTFKQSKEIEEDARITIGQNECWLDFFTVTLEHVNDRKRMEVQQANNQKEKERERERGLQVCECECVTNEFSIW